MTSGSVLRPTLALAASSLAFLVFVAIRFATPIADHAPLLAASSLCFITASLLGLAWRSWRWPAVALWSSVAFWVFLLWSTYLEASSGGGPLVPLLEAFAVVSSAGAGVVSARRLVRLQRFDRGA